MALYKDKGIVLRSFRYGEADRILDLYTADSGLVSVIAKGIRRTKSRFGGRLEPLSCVEFLAYRGKSLDTVTQVEVLRSFRGVRESLARLSAAGAMVGTAKALSGGDEADRRVFNLIYHALDALEGAREEDLKGIEAAFALKLSMLAGYAASLDKCLNCGGDPEEGGVESVPGPPYFVPSSGGVLCAGCRSAVPASESFPVPPCTLTALARLVSRPIKAATVEEGLEEAVRRVVSSHVLAHAPGSAALSGPDRRAPLRPASA